MKPQFFTLLATGCLLAASACPLMAQTATPSPSPTPAATPTASPAASSTPAATPAVGTIYGNTQADRAARLADAKAVLASNPTDQGVLHGATAAYDACTMAFATGWTDETKGIAQAVIAANGRLYPDTGDNDTIDLLLRAYESHIYFDFTKPEDKLAYIVGILNSLPSTEFSAVFVELRYHASLNAAAAMHNAAAAGNIDLAMQYASTPQALSYGDMTGPILAEAARIKIRAKAADALSWAKAAYMVYSFSDTQKGIALVSAAVTVMSNTDFGAGANAAKAQTDTTIANPLTGVPLPPLLTGGGVFIGSSSYTALDLLFTGNVKGALASAQNDLDIAIVDGDDVTPLVEGVCKIVRDVDCNIVRANAMAQALNNQQPFPITELQ